MYNMEQGEVDSQDKLTFSDMNPVFFKLASVLFIWVNKQVKRKPFFLFCEATRVFLEWKFEVIIKSTVEEPSVGNFGDAWPVTLRPMTSLRIF